MCITEKISNSSTRESLEVDSLGLVGVPGPSGDQDPPPCPLGFLKVPGCCWSCRYSVCLPSQQPKKANLTHF